MSPEDQWSVATMRRQEWETVLERIAREVHGRSHPDAVRLNVHHGDQPLPVSMLEWLELYDRDSEWHRLRLAELEAEANYRRR